MSRMKKTAKRDDKRRNAAKGGSQCGSSDDESVDTMSVVSVDSKAPRFENESADEEIAEDDYIEIDTDSITSCKNSSKRVERLDKLNKTLAGKYRPDSVAGMPATMADLIEKSLKRGGSKEQCAASTLAAILALHYGQTEDGIQIHSLLVKIFMKNLKDDSVSPDVREKIVRALTVLIFLTEQDTLNALEFMELLKTIFSKSCPQGNDPTKMPAHSQAEAALHQAALLSWALLLRMFEEGVSRHKLIDGTLATVTCLLHSPNVDVRVAAGEVLALMYEVARDHDSDFEGDDLPNLCDNLHELATDSRKYRAEKDRRMQRASFRDFEKAVRDGEKPHLDIHFATEVLRIRTWEEKLTYDTVRSFLGSGMNHHLQLNPEVRFLFNLGAPYAIEPIKSKRAKKFERAIHATNDRARTKRLAKCRDKRMDVM